MAAETPSLAGAEAALASSFRRQCVFERRARALEALVVATAAALVLQALAATPAAGAVGASVVGGLLAGLSWWLERWESDLELLRRADRLLEAGELLVTAHEQSRIAPGAGWSQLLAARARALWDAPRLRRARAPKALAALALLLGAWGVREYITSALVLTSSPAAARARSWSALAEAVGPSARADEAAVGAAAALARELQQAARREAAGGLPAELARALLARAAEAGLAAGPETPSAEARAAARAAFEVLAASYPPALPAAGRPAGSPAPSAGDGASRAGGEMIGGAAEGTMSGSTGGNVPPEPLPGTTTATDPAARPRATLGPRWWSREQDGLVKAWIEHRSQR